MKNLIALCAILLLMTSAIPKERKEAFKPVSSVKHIIAQKKAYDSLAGSVIHLQQVFKAK